MRKREKKSNREKKTVPQTGRRKEGRETGDIASRKLENMYLAKSIVYYVAETQS